MTERAEVSKESEVYDPEAHILRVMEDMCETCIFRPGNLMHLAPGKLQRMVRETREEPMGNIPCHDTLPYSLPPQEKAAVCRGWWDAYAGEKFWSTMIPIELWRPVK